MRRLRNKLITLIVLVVISSVIGTMIVTIRTFVQDKRAYVTDLNSLAAPHIASALSSQLDYIEGQLVVFDEILQDAQNSQKSQALLQSTFQKMKGLMQLHILQGRELIANIGTKSTSDLILARYGGLLDSTQSDSERLLSSVRSSQNGKKSDPVFIAKINTRTYIALLAPELISGHFSLARALSVSLVDDDGGIIVGSRQRDVQNTGLSKAVLEELKEELKTSLRYRDKQSVIVKEVPTSSGDTLLSAIATIPKTRGAVLMVQTPSTQVMRMVRQLLETSIPFVFGILILAFILGIIFSRQLSRPIEELTAATSRIAGGQWKVGIKSRAWDEIGRLVSAFSRMGRELEKREADLKRAHQELLRSESLAALGKFSAGLAHEVKNPLSSILGYSQLIQMKAGNNLDETNAKYLQFIMDETRRASKIISDLLTFARQKPPVLMPLKISEVIEHACEMLSVPAVNAKVELIKEIRDYEVVSQVDKDQIFQVLLNLITNSFHSMEEKPQGEPHRVILSLDRKAEYALIQVTDTGVGIPEENLSKLFQPFFSTKGVGKGTGLGLSMCHGIIHQHGGKIEVTSKVGEGTTFSVFLPAS